MKVTRKSAYHIGKMLGVDFKKVSFDEFRMGLEVELEHAGTIAKFAKTGSNELEIAGRIALDHLEEYPDYYTRLKRMESR